ncbi:uncharacterized protein CLUP02_15149 [Colletotrichum lupini]|uniref:Uncharacterized protein n=1 Tax=Colletotrichum lupini TaxID=145971 RepID=A0A9Q8WN06_9PEZI|nr:uncharacterized protein CLUP02_15149 [Colletotrichum lupini]UQC89618.1 hypothetical protein CLUP02_15149 [Colletotrichum lupini]
MHLEHAVFGDGRTGRLFFGVTCEGGCEQQTMGMEWMTEMVQVQLRCLGKCRNSPFQLNLSYSTLHIVASTYAHGPVPRGGKTREVLPLPVAAAVSFRPAPSIGLGR